MCPVKVHVWPITMDRGGMGQFWPAKMDGFRVSDPGHNLLWPSLSNYWISFKLIIVIQYAAIFDPNTSINHPTKIIAPRHYTAAATPLPCSTWPQRRKRWWLRRSCFRRWGPYGRRTCRRRGRGPTPIDLGHLGHLGHLGPRDSIWPTCKCHAWTLGIQSGSCLGQGATDGPGL